MWSTGLPLAIISLEIFLNMAVFSIHPEKDPFEWQKKAREDRQLAHALAHSVDFGSRYPSHICFLCQQCIEKYLKALLVAAGYEPSRTHDLENLLRECLLLCSTLAPFKDQLGWLTPFAAEMRYPHEDSVPVADAKRGLKQAEEVERIVQEFFAKHSV